MFVRTFILFSTIFMVQSADPEIPTYECKISDWDKTRCDLVGLQLTKEQPYFKIQIDQPEKIRGISISGSIPVLTNSICNSFPALEHLSIPYSKIETVLENAFENCAEIKDINLMNNKIKGLHVNTFKNNLKLSVLYLETNRIKRLEEDTFINLVELQILMLGNNNLTEFSPMLLKRSQKMGNLQLYTNNLSDFDLESLHNLNPSLNILYINNNEISCIRMQELVEFALVRDDFFFVNFQF